MAGERTTVSPPSAAAPHLPEHRLVSVTLTTSVLTPPSPDMISDDNRRPEQIRKMENGRYALFEGLVRAYIASSEVIYIDLKHSLPILTHRAYRVSIPRSHRHIS